VSVRPVAPRPGGVSALLAEGGRTCLADESRVGIGGSFVNVPVGESGTGEAVGVGGESRVENASGYGSLRGETCRILKAGSSFHSKERKK
jgi:hypothetical protein